MAEFAYQHNYDTVNTLVIIRSIQKTQGLVLIRLSTEKYVSGIRYWQHGDREFADDRACDACVVIHNNWIVSVEAKRYRFREMYMWFHDHGYYRFGRRTVFVR